MGTSAEELRWRLDEQRADLSRDLEAIGDRVSPGRMVDRRKAAVRSRWEQAREAVMGTTHTGTETMSHQASGLADRAGGMASGAADMARSAPDAMRHTAEGNPLAAGLVAFGLGMVAAAVLPGTRREQQLAERAQPQLEHAATVAREKAQEMAQTSAEHMKPSMQEHAQQLQEHAREAMDDVKGQAKTAAADVRGEAKGAAEDVRSSTDAGGTGTGTPGTLT